MRATTSDACRTASVWCGSVKKKLRPRNDRKDATIPLPAAGDRAGGDHGEEAERGRGGEIPRAEGERDPDGRRRGEDPDREDEP